MDKPLRDLIEIIHFTEMVGTKIYGLLSKAEIYRTVIEEFKKAKRYSASIVLLTDDGTKLKLAETTLPPGKLKALEKATGLNLRNLKTDLNKSSFFRQVVREGKTIQVKVSEILDEIFPRPLAHLIAQIIGYEGKFSILTPLTLNNKTIGALGVSTTELFEYFIPSVKNLAQQISFTLELSREYAKRRRAERKLKQIEKYYRSLFENALDMVAVVDSDMIIRHESPPFERMLGYKPEEVVGKPAIDFFHPEDRVTTSEAFAQLIQNPGATQSVEFRARHKDGSWRLLQATGKNLLHNPAVRGVVINYRDITEQKQVEKTLRQTSKNLKELAHIVHHTPAIAFLWRATQGWPVEFVSDNVQQFGYTPEDFYTGQLLYTNIVHPDDLERVAAEVDKYSQEEGRTEFTQEYRIITKSGGVRWVDDRTWIRRGPDGTITHYQGIVLDITDRKRMEETLQDSERHYRLLADNATDVIWTMDMNLRYTYVSPSITRQRGYNVEEMVNHGLEDYLTPASAEIARKALEEELAIENMGEVDLSRSRILELESICKDGSTIWIETKMTFLRDQDGRPVGILGVSRDITEKKRAEEKLRESEEIARTLLNAPIDLALLIDPDGTIVALNEPAAKSLGKDKSELIGMCVLDFFPPDVAQKREAEANKVIRSGKPSHFEDKRAGKWFEQSIYPIFDAKGKVVRLAAFIRDITEQRRAEEELKRHRRQLQELVKERTVELTRANEQLKGEITRRKRMEETLRESEEQLKAIFEGVQDAIFTKDRKGHYQQVNTACASLFGLTTEKMIGKDDFDLFPPDVARYLQKIDKKVIEKGEAISTEDTNPMSGVMRTFHVARVPLRDANGAIVGLCGIARDVTERKQVEEQIRRFNQELQEQVEERAARVIELERERTESEKLAATGRMAARIAHEINNPLGGIKNSFLLIKDAIPKDHTYYKYVGLIEKETERIARIVSQMFDLYRPDQESAREFSIKETIDDVVALLAVNSRESGIQIETDTKDASKIVILPEALIRQVLFNLLQNAIEASPPRGTVRIEAGVADEVLTVMVSDQGSGIPEEIRSRIFEPFFTTKNSQNSHGIGLGLSICRNLVEVMGGSLDYESKEGEGTLFRITLPAKIEQKEVQTA